MANIGTLRAKMRVGRGYASVFCGENKKVSLKDNGLLSTRLSMNGLVLD